MCISKGLEDLFSSIFSEFRSGLRNWFHYGLRVSIKVLTV